MKNGSAVAEFESAFANYVGAKFAIALCNGTATLHTALAAMGVKPGDHVAVPPLTMASTTIAVLQAGAVPVFCDVDPETWLLADADISDVFLPVALYGLRIHRPGAYQPGFRTLIDAAQTLQPHPRWCSFTSYSFQSSKILALGEGGMLVTNDEELATRAREFSSLGYRMRADQPRIDSRVIRDPAFERHHLGVSWNYRMNDLTARAGLAWLAETDMTASRVTVALDHRAAAASWYASAVAGCPWITPQRVPDGWTHDYWSYAVALESADIWHPFADAIERHGGERPYAAWRLTFSEPAFRHLDPGPDACPMARSLQPRIMAFQTNDLASAERNAEAVAKAIREVGG